MPDYEPTGRFLNIKWKTGFSLRLLQDDQEPLLKILNLQTAGTVQARLVRLISAIAHHERSKNRPERIAGIVAIQRELDSLWGTPRVLGKVDSAPIRCVWVMGESNGSQIEVGGDVTIGVYIILRLAERGLAHRLQECGHCHRWIFARREWQKFCPPPRDCRRRHEERVRKSPAEREKRKEYMRKYRKDQSQRERAALAKIKRTRGEK